MELGIKSYKCFVNTAMLKSMAVFILLTTTCSLFAQKVNSFHRGQMIEHYHVHPSDTSIKHGSYQLFYKNHLIENGQYNKGKKSGVWSYFNLGDAFEFQYDFDRDSMVRISGMERQLMLREESPCLFLGSPLVPYVFILNSVGYPIEAFQRGISGKVDLFMIISEDGRIIRRYVDNSDHRILSRAVLQASRDFPDDWRWIPERRQNRKIESAYKITIHFDLQ